MKADIPMVCAAALARAGCLTIAALAASTLPAFASGVIDNVNGMAVDPNGKIVHFRALLIDDDGKVEKLLPDRYQEPEYKPKKPKKGQPWPERPKGLSFRMDAGGKTLIPGLIDAHGHVMGLGLSLITLDLSDTKSLAEAQAKIRAYAQDGAGRKWIIGTGWNQEQWGLGRFPTAADLDAAVSDIPAYPEAEAITADDFRLESEGLERALDVVAVCRGPRR